MKFQRTVEMSTIEMMENLKEDLIKTCISVGGRINLSGEEEKALIDLWTILDPMARQVIVRNDIIFELKKLGRKEKLLEDDYI